MAGCGKVVRGGETEMTGVVIVGLVGCCNYLSRGGHNRGYSLYLVAGFLKRVGSLIEAGGDEEKVVVN